MAHEHDDNLPDGHGHGHEGHDHGGHGHDHEHGDHEHAGHEHEHSGHEHSGHEHGGHGHGHGGHDHSHALPTNRRALVAVLTISAILAVAQVVGLLVTGSLGLAADALDKVIDVAALVIALVVEVLASRPATSKRTWGMQRLEVLAGCIRAAIMLGVGVMVVWNGIGRLIHPEAIVGQNLLIFGIIGMVFNGIKVLILRRSASSSFNMRSITLDALNDALGSVGITVAALIMMFTHGYRADTIVGIGIALFIIPRAFQLLSETLNVLLEGTPPGMDLDEVRESFLAVPYVREVHDLHASLIASETPQITAHIVVDDNAFHNGQAVEILRQLQTVTTGVGVQRHHSTLQLEPLAMHDDDLELLGTADHHYQHDQHHHD
ncbi:MAG: cation diffusion facilitator family transporter [Promicromonosporaceae bacterium]|nr:cation diffusion facilitator family transporter [Promicromonosporaceae bacterium]